MRRPAAAASLPAAVDMYLASGSIPTRQSVRPSASQHVPMVGIAAQSPARVISAGRLHKRALVWAETEAAKIERTR